MRGPSSHQKPTLTAMITTPVLIAAHRIERGVCLASLSDKPRTKTASRMPPKANSKAFLIFHKRRNNRMIPAATRVPRTMKDVLTVRG